MKKLQNQGFTIIELLIATVTFSLILLIITGAIIQFSKLYYKGVISSKTQEVARSIADEVSRAAQFSTGFEAPDDPATATEGAYCLGDRRFRFKLNTLRTGSNRVLISDVSAASCEADMTNISDDDRELAGDEMQLREFKIEPRGESQYDITVTVAYGSDIQGDNTCPAIILGGQFCAVSTVKSTVTKRL